MKELTFHPAGKNLFKKVSKITLEQRFLNFTSNAIFLTMSIAFRWLVSRPA